MFFQTLTYFFLWMIVGAYFIILQLLIRIGDFGAFIRNEKIGTSFDYVIVGGGTAGSILAARLSENPNVSVLLIEAGGEGFEVFNIPVLGTMKQLSDLDWQHDTVPQNFSCLALENNVSKWPSGKILGGSTHLNYMIYLTGHKKDYSTWKDPRSSNWDLQDVRFYYEKSLKCVRTREDQKDGCFGKRGSMLVRKDMSHVTELSEAILQAASELKYSLSDLNTETNTGFMKTQLNMNEFGRRWTSDQYLKKVKSQRKNLKILTNAVAEKILLKNGFEAYAVQIKRFGKTETVFANFEVIVSAGTVGSAKLLMLSGIGPASELAKAKVKPEIDLPVGRNLQDHVTTGLDLVLVDRTLFSFTDLMMPSSAFEYFVRGRGPFTSGLVDAVGTVHSRLADPARDAPDLEFMVLIAGLSSDKGVFLKKSMGIKKKIWDQYFSHLLNESVVSVIPVLLHPKSIGEITLDPVRPEGKPRIDPRYLSEKEDVDTLVEGIRIVEKMTRTSSMKKLGAKLNERKFPGCESLEFDSDAYWGCYVRHLTLTVYHPVGTCKMGTLEEGGVVDYRLKVHKTNKLRVVDASIMPSLPSANTNAAVVMIAEKGADLIKEDHGNRRSSCRPPEIFLETLTCPSSPPF